MTLFTYDTNQPKEPKGSRGWAFLAGAIAGALILAVAWWGASALTPAERTADDSRAEQPQPLSAGASSHGPGVDEAPDSDDSAVQSYLARCQEVAEAQEAPLDALAHSLDQWEVHIGAMNKLVTGAITLKQANQFWNQTRLGAASRLKRATAARQRFGDRTARCPSTQEVASRFPEARSCQQAVQARNRTLRLGTTALATWEVHVHHMEMLRRGEMTPEEATHLWLQSWRTGDAQVRAYRAAAQEASTTACCSGAPSCE